MASEDRSQDHHLSFLAAAREDLGKYGLFPLVRGAEARALDKPRVGYAKRPELDIVKLAQEPHLGFAPRTIASIDIDGGQAELRGYWLGLTGPQGALPTHLSEYAYFERRYSKVYPFGDWLDLLAGRMLQLFYRAWAEASPAALADRPDDDRFATYLAALSGAMEGAAEGAAFAARARVHYAGLFASRRSAVAIEDGLGHLLGQRVKLMEFQPRWRSLEPEDRTRLGQGYATLGNDAVLGSRVRTASDAFRVVIRAQNFRDYKSLLPGSERFAIAAEALDSFSPSNLEWDICLELDNAEAPPMRLDGRVPLGWASWMKHEGSEAAPYGKIRADAHLRRIRSPSRGTQP